MRELFRRFAAQVSEALGSSWAFFLALLSIAIWAATGPFFHYSETWQLIINTGTTIVTFLMVFLIQNTQNRDSRALHLKLDELIRSTTEARNAFINLESLPDEELEKLHAELSGLCERYGPDVVGTAHAAVKESLARRQGKDRRAGDRKKAHA